MGTEKTVSRAPSCSGDQPPAGGAGGHEESSEKSREGAAGPAPEPWPRAPILSPPTPFNTPPRRFPLLRWGSHDRLHPLSRNDFSQLPREPLSSPGMTRVPLASGRHCCPQPGCRLLVGQAGLREPWAGSAGGGALRVQGGAGPTASPDGGPAVFPGTEEWVPEGVG